MALVAAPPPLMTETAQGLLKAAAELGLPASVVATTSDTLMGLGFDVPDEVALRWQETQAAPQEPEGAVVVTEPEPEPEAPKTRTGRRGPGKSNTSGPEV
jgi:hypothetical protein